MAHTESTRVWTAPPGWPVPPDGWSPGLGWQPDPTWPAVPVGHQWWQPTQRGLRRRRTAVVLVGLSSTIGVLHGIDGIVARTLEDHALHARHGWHQSIGVTVLVALVWWCSVALLLPAGSIGASELNGERRSGRVRAASFVALLCGGVVGQYWTFVRAYQSSPWARVRDDWLHDGRSWFALACLIATLTFVGTVVLFRSAGDYKQDARPLTES